MSILLFTPTQLLFYPFYPLPQKAYLRPARFTRNNKNYPTVSISFPKMDNASSISLFHSISPSLAAYHYLRSTKAPSVSRCSRCGHILHCPSHTRLVRMSSPRPSSPIVRCLRQTCATCGHVNNKPVNQGFPIHSRHVITPPPPHHPSLSSDLTNPYLQVVPCTPAADRTMFPDTPPISPQLDPSLHSSPSLPSLANAQPQPPTKTKKQQKSRPKHKAGLQEMIARNRDRQRHVTADRGSQAGLGTFLRSL
jgi:hypothetical protein